MRVAARVFNVLLLIILSACSGGPSFIASESQPAEPPTPTVEAATPTVEAAPPTPTVEAVSPTSTPQPASSTTGELSLVDTSGATLTFAKPPERIIALGVRDLEILAALGIEPIAVAPYTFLEKLSRNPLYFKQPNDIKVLQAAEGDLGVDLEEIAALKPDLVFGWEEVRTGLTDIAPVYDAYTQQDTYQDSFEELRKFAKLFGQEAQAEAAIKKFEDRLAAYKKLSPRNVSVMYVGGTTQEVFIRHGKSGTCNLFNEVALCDWEDPTQGGFWSYTASLENLLQLDPDVLLLESWDDQLNTAELIAEYEQNPLLAELKAVKNGRLIPIESDAKDLDGMGVIGATRQLDTYMPILYPDIFPQPLTDEQVQEILAGEAVGESTGQYQITDATGVTLTFETPPEHLICLYHECIELVSALGVEPLAILAPDWLPAFADDPAYFKQPNEIVRLQPQESGSWDYEELAALKPDLVFGSDEDRTALEGITQVYSVGNTYSMTNQDTLDHLLELGQLLGLEAEAQAAIQRFQDRLAAYKANSPGDRSVLLVASDLQEAWIYSGESVPCSILNEVARCDWPNPDPQPGSWGYSSTVEAVLQLDPDVLIFENWSELPTDEALAQLKENPLWSELQAFQNDRVFSQNNRDAYGLGPIGGARLLDLYMPLIYPEIFPEPLTDEQIQELVAE